MGRKPLKPHELRIVRKPRGAYVNYRNRAIYLGKWDWERGEPSAEAVTRFEALRALWRAEPDADLPESLAPLLLDVWADWRASPQGPRNRPEDLLRVQRLLFGNAAAPGPHLETRAADFRPGDFLDWQTSLCGPPLNYSRWTVGQCRRLVLACFDWASVKGLVDEFHPGALARVKPPSRGQVKDATVRIPVPDADYRAAIEQMRPVARAACELIRLTGARPSEVLGLTSADIVRRGSIRTAKGIEFPLPKGVWAAVKLEHKMQRKGFDRVLFFGKRGRAILAGLTPAPGGPLLPTGSGRAYCSKSLGDAIAGACERAGVPVFTPYRIRHSRAVELLRSFSEAEVGCYLGHRSRGSTGVYAGTDLRTAARVALSLG